MGSLPSTRLPRNVWDLSILGPLLDLSEVLPQLTGLKAKSHIYAMASKAFSHETRCKPVTVCKGQ